MPVPHVRSLSILPIQATKRTLVSGEAEAREPALQSCRIWVSPTPRSRQLRE